jgi:hypothetical protein
MVIAKITNSDILKFFIDGFKLSFDEMIFQVYFYEFE